MRTPAHTVFTVKQSATSSMSSNQSTTPFLLPNINAKRCRKAIFQLKHARRQAEHDDDGKPESDRAQFYMCYPDDVSVLYALLFTFRGREKGDISCANDVQMDGPRRRVCKCVQIDGIY